jgi:hypothetical protein
MFSILLNCTGPTTLLSDTLLALAAQSDRNFELQLLDPSAPARTTAQLLDLNVTDHLSGDFRIELTAFDIPLAHWLSTFAAHTADPVGSVSACAARQPIGWRQWRREVGFEPTGLVETDSGDVTVAQATGRNGARRHVDEFTLLRRYVG